MDSMSEFDLTVPRSCWACHKKKIKCSRGIPCSACARAGTKCDYPSLDQRKKSRRIPVNALMNRLAHLEKQVSSLSSVSGVVHPRTAPRRIDEKPAIEKTESRRPENQPVDPASPGVLTNQQGENNYVGDSFIASLHEDARELATTAEHARLSDRDLPSTPFNDFNIDLNTFPADQSLALGPRSGWRTLRLWQVYQSNIEPLLKILHAPSTQDKIYAAVNTTRLLPDTERLLLAAICFAAMSSLDNEESLSLFNLQRQYLLQQYRDEVEKYVGTISLMTSPTMEYLQALTIFISTLRAVDTSRAVWILTGLAVRIAQSLGLHLDGAALDIPPFEGELRRRVWWHLFILEQRAAEDHGLLVSDFVASKRPPLYPSNINDEDIWPEMTEPPIPSKTATSMSLTIIRIQLADAVIHVGLHPVRATNGQELLKIMEESRCKAKEGFDRCQQDWLSTEEHKLAPYYHAASRLLKFSSKKAEFLICFRAYQSPLLEGVQKEEIRKQTVISALEVVEGIRTMESNSSLKRFYWFSRSHPQWFANGFLLQQLYRGMITENDIRQRVRAAIEDSFDLRSDTDHNAMVHRRGAIWIALQLLKQKALEDSVEYKTPNEATTPESTDFDALDSMFDLDTFDFSQMPSMDLAMFDADINFDLPGFDTGY